jgi:hypothetical protein
VQCPLDYHMDQGIKADYTLFKCISTFTVEESFGKKMYLLLYEQLQVYYF